MKSLKFTSVVLALILSQMAGANALYSWKHKDGTPTFSPDPPPKGVPYVIVGPDLKPIPQPLPGLNQNNNQNNNAGQSQSIAQQAQSQPSVNALPPASISATPAKRAGDIVMTPAPGSAGEAAKPQPALNTPEAAKPDWKPVMYADDPNPARNNPVTSATTAPEPTAASRITVECLDVKQQLLMLESKFANAATATEMDTAIVNINSYRKAKKGLCGL